MCPIKSYQDDFEKLNEISNFNKSIESAISDLNW